MFFSIIIPTFNREHLIARSITSVLNQTYHDWECIIIDDASTDNTKEIVKQFQDPRIRYFKNKVNVERCVSRNIGIEHAKGKYICFLDSDDYHLPEHLETFYETIQLQQITCREKYEPVAFFFTNAWNESEDGQRSERVCPDFSITDPYSYFLRYTVNPQRWCVHRDVFKEVQFDPNVTICEDMDASLRITAAGYPIIQIPKRTTIYVAARDSFTHGDSAKSEKELFYLKRIFNKIELKKHLQKKEINRLLSMCHFHLAQKANLNKDNWNAFKHSILSFILFPKGYNGKTNKIVFVTILYNLPLIGSFIKYVKKWI